tara:strand:- start:998 stop:1501 length:504 start_codon:yes stop_codon:yes gene_type:complete
MTHIFKILIIIVAFSKISLAKVNVNSIIKLNENIPEECGLRFTINDGNNSIEASISIKKLENQDTSTKFVVNSDKNINNADIQTQSAKISEIINDKNSSKTNFILSGKANQDSVTFFFQELLVGGGNLLFDEMIHEIKGPIDSKVRLEYLFCTGEMFLPNYESNNNE